MKWIVGRRASSVLYSFLISNGLMHKRVALPANICQIVPLTFLKANCNIIFVDIDYNYVMDETMIEQLCEKQQIDILFFVRTYGIQEDFNQLFNQVKKWNPSIVIIEDCCLCKPDLETLIHDNIDLQLYSTGYAKYVELGEGGFGKVQDWYSNKNIVDEFEPIHLERIKEEYIACIKEKRQITYKESNWLDLRRCEVSRDVYFEKVQEIYPRIEVQKNKINDIYYEIIPKVLQFKKCYQDWRFNIYVANKNEVLKALYQNELFASSHYVSVQGVFTTIHFPNVFLVQSGIINLFNDFRYNEDMAYKTACIIKNLGEEGEIINGNLPKRSKSH